MKPDLSGFDFVLTPPRGVECSEHKAVSIYGAPHQCDFISRNDMKVICNSLTARRGWVRINLSPSPQSPLIKGGDILNKKSSSLIIINCLLPSPFIGEGVGGGRRACSYTLSAQN